jgi:CubicO group peptidase (beta-lactamase class C family)
MKADDFRSAAADAAKQPRMELTRRLLLRSSLAASAWLTLCRSGVVAKPDPGPVDRLVAAYRTAWDVPALSLAYGRDGRILLAQAYGLAERHSRRAATPQSLFRIASLSKPITSAAIFTLVEAGSLRTGDRVFGRDGILRSFALRRRANWLQAITVEHLLTHTAGGWSNGEHDPMFHNTARSRTAFIQQTLDAHELEDPPGTSYAYSNFGYFLLGRVIEQISGVPYGQYVRQHVQAPLGISNMQLARKSPAEGEVHYYGLGRGDPYAVPVELHDANGGWIATPADLVRFALGVFSTEDKADVPVLFKPETLRQMTRVSTANPRYACGWSVSPDGDCWHSGGFDGAAGFLVHRHDGLAWAVLVNTRRAHSNMEKELHDLSWKIADGL